MKGSLDKRIFFRKSDGTVRMIMLNPQAMQKNETEEQFIDRITSQWKTEKPHWSLEKVFIKSKDDLNKLFVNNPKAHLDRLKITEQGVLYIDEQTKTNEETYQEKKLIVRNKLKSGQPLNDDEIDLLIGKQEKS